MKITLNNISEQKTIEVDLPASVILEQLQPRIDKELTTYKDMPVEKRIALKFGIRTAQAFAEKFTGMKIEFPAGDDFIITLLENLPIWIEQLMERIEIDAATVNQDTRHSTVTRAGIRLQS